ncbi:MAG: hypothetical protein HFG14_08475 [Lachnospiraceae bacterium]|nr:hypothetical protein [Lachnospiraceae bacterium]
MRIDSNLHAPTSEDITKNESSQAPLASLNLDRLRRWAFTVNLHAPTSEDTTKNESSQAPLASLNLYLCRE